MRVFHLCTICLPFRFLARCQCNKQLVYGTCTFCIRLTFIVNFRELAFQIGDQFVIFGKPLNIKVSVVTGGRSESFIYIDLHKSALNFTDTYFNIFTHIQCKLAFLGMIQQGVELSRQPHIVVSTPGRLADHLRTGTNFSLSKIRYLVSYVYPIVS